MAAGFLLLLCCPQYVTALLNAMVDFVILYTAALL
jgi:hypothetical protein